MSKFTTRQGVVAGIECDGSYFRPAALQSETEYDSA